MNRNTFIPLAGIATVLLLSALAGFYGRLQLLAVLFLPLVFVKILYTFYPNFQANRRHWILDQSLVLIGGLSIYFSLECAGEWRFFLLFGGLFLILCGAMPSFDNEDISHKPLSVVGMCLSTVASVVLPLLILGMNPFSVTQYSVKDSFQQYAYSQRGVYIIEKDSLMGLRDRWGMIVPPQFISMHIMKKTQPYMEVKSPEGVGIYNVEKHEFTVSPNPRCIAIVQAGESVWNMLDKDEKSFRQIRLPKFWLDGFDDAQLETFDIPDNEKILIAQKLNDIY